MVARCGVAVLATVMILACSSGAVAAPGLSNKVYAPYVKKGVTEVELRAGRLTGGPADGEQAAVVEVEYGVNDRLSLAVLGEFEQHAGEARKLDAFAIEGVAYLGQVPGLGIDVGGYLEYEQRIHNESGVAEAKLLLAKRSGGFEGLLNLIATRPLSDRPGAHDTEFGYAAQATWAVTDTVRLGGQAFGELGTDRAFGGPQPHYLGPVAQWELHPRWLQGGELELEAAYLLPAGAAKADSDGQIRVVVEYEKHF